MTHVPLSIRLFETLQILSVIIGTINGFAAIGLDLVNTVVGAVVVLALTFLVSRRRKDWARWALLALFVLGMAVTAWNVSALLSFGYVAATVAFSVDVMNAVALVLLFTPESANWLRTSQSTA